MNTIRRFVHILEAVILLAGMGAAPSPALSSATETGHQIAKLSTELDREYAQDIQEYLRRAVQSDRLEVRSRIMSQAGSCQIGGTPTTCIQSEGVHESGADLWQARGWTGQGTKIAIFDDFNNYEKMQDVGELPGKGKIEFYGTVKTDPNDSEYGHGVPVAEIIHDMAPDAQLAFVKPDDRHSDVDLIREVVRDGYDIINFSSGAFFGSTAGDGATKNVNVDWVKAMVDAEKDGVIIVFSAGNNNRTHWNGAYTNSGYIDPDSGLGGWHAFTSDTRYRPDLGRYYSSLINLLGSRIVYSGKLDFYVRWNDWNATHDGNHSGVDYDLYLMRWNGKKWEPVNLTKEPNPANLPLERIVFQSTGSHDYGIAIRRVSGSGSHHLDLHSWMGPPLEFNTRERSLQDGATLPFVIGVGAFDINARDIADYSGWGPILGPGGTLGGPTHDQPFITGYTEVHVYSRGTFNGTSAAAPHVAGAAALIKSAFPWFSAQQIRDYLSANAKDEGPTGYDSVYGYGRLNLGAPRPRSDKYVRAGDLLFVDPQAGSYESGALFRIDPTNYMIAPITDFDEDTQGNELNSSPIDLVLEQESTDSISVYLYGNPTGAQELIKANFLPDPALGQNFEVTSWREDTGSESYPYRDMAANPWDGGLVAVGNIWIHHEGDDEHGPWSEYHGTVRTLGRFEPKTDPMGAGYMGRFLTGIAINRAENEAESYALVVDQGGDGPSKLWKLKATGEFEEIQLSSGCGAQPLRSVTFEESLNTALFLDYYGNLFRLSLNVANDRGTCTKSAHGDIKGAHGLTVDDRSGNVLVTMDGLILILAPDLLTEVARINMRGLNPHGIAVIRSAPTANDDSYTVQENQSLTVDAPGVLGNDNNVNGDTLNAVLVNNVSNGTLSFTSDGSFTYTPNPGFAGNESFTYRASDGIASSNEATVSILVTPSGATITIVQDTQPGSKHNFRFSGDLGEFRLDDREPQDGDSLSNNITFPVAAGRYAVQQTVPGRWYLSDAACSPESNSVITVEAASLTITVDDGDHVTCTFEDNKFATIRVRKYLDENGNGRRNDHERLMGGWIMTLYDDQGNQLDQMTTNEFGKANFRLLRADRYTVCETLQDGWFATQPRDFNLLHGEPCHSLTVGPGETALIRFGNSLQPPQKLKTQSNQDDSIIIIPASDDIGDENDEGIGVDEDSGIPDE